MRSSTSPLRDLVRKRDFYAGGLMLLLGLGIALKGVSYRAGTLMHMGPGLLADGAWHHPRFARHCHRRRDLAPSEMAGEETSASCRNIRNGGAGSAFSSARWLFIIFGRYFGMVPATFACVFVAALGDKTATWKGTFILATVVTVFGVALFSYFLQVPMPILTWRGDL